MLLLFFFFWGGVIRSDKQRGRTKYGIMIVTVFGDSQKLEPLMTIETCTPTLHSFLQSESSGILQRNTELNFDVHPHTTEVVLTIDLLSTFVIDRIALSVEGEFRKEYAENSTIFISCVASNFCP